MSGGATPLAELLPTLAERKKRGERVVFTNGCFDLLHPGHVAYLAEARELGDLLVVGLNSDASVKKLEKGVERPIMTEEERAAVLSGLRSVDYVVIFGEETPIRLIEAIVPDVLVKGGDWPLESIVGKDVVEKAGGAVRTIPFVAGKSTTGLVERIISRLTGK